MRKWKALNREIIECDQCPRLVAHCKDVAEKKRRAYLGCDYWGKPVPNFGDPRGLILILGLAPGAHGANRTGRMFTGDRSGDWLYRALHKADLANQPDSAAQSDGLELNGCAVTNVCHCAPPANKPSAEELLACRSYLERTIDILEPRVFLALGQIAWRAAFRVFREREWYSGSLPKFGHGTDVALSGNAEGRFAIASYHPSQQNTFTGRLTERMLNSVIRKAKRRAGI